MAAVEGPLQDPSLALCATPSVPPHDRWAKALASLNKHDKLQLSQNITNKDRLEVLREIIVITAEKKRRCIQKAWKFKRRDGKVVIIRDLLEKIAVWVQKFKEVGDIAVSFDPVHAALPWAAVRFLISLSIDDVQNFGAMTEGIEKIAMLITRCEVLERLYLKPGVTDDTGFEDSLIGLYVAILKFQSNAIRFYGKNTTIRILSGAISSSEKDVEENLKKIAEAQAGVDACAKLIDAQYQRATDQHVDRVATAVEGTHTKLDSLISNYKNLTLLDENHLRLETLLKQVQGPIIRTATLLEDYEDSLQVREREEILQWLSDIPYQKHHKLKRSECLQGSCRWLLDSEEFNGWKASSTSSILWLHGTSGTGKSVLVSAVIENLRQDQSGKPGAAPIAFFYCSRNPGEPERANPEDILRSILEQVASNTAREPIRPAVVEAYKTRKEDARGRSPEPLDIEETTDVLLKILQENPVTIVIDALDECDPDKRHDLLSALDTIITESASLVRVFVSSRDDGDIVCQLKDSPNMFITASDNSGDIASYVEAQVSEAIKKKRLIRGKVSDEMRQQIVDVLTDGAQGMFRWVSLQIQQLCDNKRIKHEDDIKLQLGKLPKTLWDSYDVIYKAILDMAGASQKLAIRTLQVLFCAQRKLTVAEMVAAVSVDSTGEALISSEADLLDACCNMIFLDEQVQSFRFAHLSVREYLEGRSDYNPKATSLFLLERCLGVFVRRAGDQKPEPKRSEFISNQDDIFNNYSSAYWPAHCQLAFVDADKSVVLKMFVGNQGVASNAFNEWVASCTARIRKLMTAEVLDLSDGAGETDREKQLYLPGRDINISMHNPPTILLVSCIYGLTPIIQYLLPRKDVDWNVGYPEDIECSKDIDRYRTIDDVGWNLRRTNNGQIIHPLVLAAGRGYKDIVELVLSRDKSCYTKGDPWYIFGASALCEAVECGHISIVKLLIEHGVDPNSRGLELVNRFTSVIQTPLPLAAASGNQEIARLLLLHKADPNSSCTVFRKGRGETVVASALYKAIQSRSFGITKMLLEAGASLEGDNEADSGNPLHIAAQYGDEEAVALLLRKGIHPNDDNWRPRDIERTRAVHYAAQGGHAQVINILFQAGADIQARDYRNRTAAWFAAKHGRVSVLKTLKALGASLANTDTTGKTVWEIVAQSGSKDAIQVLIEDGIDIQSVNDNQEMALHLAARSYFVSENDTCNVVQLLLEHGAPVDAKDAWGRTALSIAVSAREPSIRIVDTLLAHGADLSIRDIEGNTLLFRVLDTAKEFDEKKKEVAEYLLSKGAEFGLNKVQEGPIMCAIARLDSNSILEHAIAQGCNFDAKDNTGLTPLIWAIEVTSVSMVELLLSAGADFQSLLDLSNFEGLEDIKACRGFKDSEGRTKITFLGEAVRVGNEKVVKLLLEKGAGGSDINQLVMQAAADNKTAIVQTLLDAGADIEFKNEDQETPLLASMKFPQRDRNEEMETAAFLIETNANILVEDNLGTTPLYLSVRCGYPSILQLLVSRGADVRCRVRIADWENPSEKQDKGTLLHVAAHRGNCHRLLSEDVIRKLVTYGVPLEEKNEMGETALHIAVQEGNKPAIRTLQELGADFECMDNEGIRPIDIMNEWNDGEFNLDGSTSS